MLTDYFVSGAIAQNCDFEKSLCNYKQDTSDNYDWSWGAHGRNTSAGNGPTSDHTTKDSKSELLFKGKKTYLSCLQRLIQTKVSLGEFQSRLYKHKAYRIYHL